jgi:hypothetical protein
MGVRYMGVGIRVIKALLNKKVKLRGLATKRIEFITEDF